MENFRSFFLKCTEFSPYPYQESLAEEPIQSRLIHVPTGAGKTAASILAWLWQRHVAPEKTPRRLVYCLPMRVLVEQTRDKAREWVAKVAPDVRVYTLMGGEVEEDWEIYPEKPAILVGTQDMLLSRALNRGYAMSRYRWPVHFGLLNNDCLWVCDEVQLMGSGLGATTQLQGFREELGVYGPVVTWWMSATMERAWLETVGYGEKAAALERIGLEPGDLADSELKLRYEASKPATRLADMSEAALAARILTEHVAGSLTLVVLNSVDRAQKLYEEVKKASRKNRSRTPELILAHSRFRAAERGRISERIQGAVDAQGSGRIVVATQVIEAGVDVSARVLFSELAPWGSMVQRFGRCNRKGEYGEQSPARIFWINLPDNKAKPYTEDELAQARQLLESLADARISAVAKLAAATRRSPLHVVRRKDLLELFDTTPDLSGADLDISRYIREEEELDVGVFWREIAADAPGRDEPQPRPEELCSVPFYAVREYLKREGRAAFRWNPLEGRWDRSGASIPGQVYLLAASKGGYSLETGWNARLEEPVEPLPPAAQAEEDYDADRYSAGGWITIAEHSDDVARMIEELLTAVQTDSTAARALQTAAHWHDRGKAHPVFQEAVPEDPAHPKGDWAKAPGAFRRYTRPHFRHELASALALLQAGSELIGADLRELAAYLAAAHHGRVRLSIRSLPNERAPDSPGKRFARGIWEGDLLPATRLGRGIAVPEVRLNLELMEMGLDDNGNASWAERMLKLRDDAAFGPFRVAFMEALLRAADRRASAIEVESHA